MIHLHQDVTWHAQILQIRRWSALGPQGCRVDAAVCHEVSTSHRPPSIEPRTQGENAHDFADSADLLELGSLTVITVA